MGVAAGRAGGLNATDDCHAGEPNAPINGKGRKRQDVQGDGGGRMGGQQL